MIFTLLNVQKTEDDRTVSGSFIQDHIGTLESAIQRAKDIEAVNSNKIDVAVIEDTCSNDPLATYFSMRRLDGNR